MMTGEEPNLPSRAHFGVRPRITQIAHIEWEIDPIPRYSEPLLRVDVRGKHRVRDVSGKPAPRAGRRFQAPW